MNRIWCDDEPRNTHDAACPSWNSDNPDNCDCDQVRSPNLALPDRPQPRPPVHLACDGDVDLPEGA